VLQPVIKLTPKWFSGASETVSRLVGNGVSLLITQKLARAALVVICLKQSAIDIRRGRGTLCINVID